MNATDPLILRCLALTGSFETGLLPPGCFSSLAGDFDGQGLSYSCLQWNIGQKTLQPLLAKVFAAHPDVVAKCFPGFMASEVQAMLNGPLAQQLGWARSIQGPMNHKVNPAWASAFATLGASPEWQAIAQESAAGYFDHAKFQASQLKLKSDRAIALLFDCCVQNGGVRPGPMRAVLAAVKPDWGELDVMHAIAREVADSADPKYHKDVLTRKETIADGVGIVHGLRYDLEKDFAL